jgi:hypothetical protein
VQGIVFYECMAHPLNFHSEAGQVTNVGGQLAPSRRYWALRHRRSHRVYVIAAPSGIGGGDSAVLLGTEIQVLR